MTSLLSNLENCESGDSWSFLGVGLFPNYGSGVGKLWPYEKGYIYEFWVNGNKLFGNGNETLGV